MSTVARNDDTVLAIPESDADELRWDEWAASLPHDCEPQEGSDEPTADKGARGRLAGIDLARGVALLGMVAVHVCSATTDDGDLSFAWLLAAGTASALFAVLAGIGLAFMSGRTTPPSGAQHWRVGRRLAVRALVIAAVGLALGLVVPRTAAGVILPYLGLLFAMAIPVLHLRSRTLFVLAGLWAVLAPVASHLLRSGRPVPQPTNLSPAEVVANPLASLEYVLVSGLYPALTWFAFILLGLGLGRLDLQLRRYALKFAVVGVLVGFGATLLSDFVMGTLGGVDRLASDVMGGTTLADLTDMLIWGGSGTAPADSWWWFGSAGAHTGLPLDLLHTGGVAMAVLGVCLALAAVAGPALRVLAIPGSMTFTLYSLHLLLLVTPISELPDAVGYATHIVLLVTFALLWRRRFSRGPMEWLVWYVAGLVGRSKGRHRGPGRALGVKLLSER